MRLANAFPLAQIDDTSLAAMMRVPPKDVATTRQAYVTRFRDPAQAEAVLHELPVPSLVVLACLVDAGGMMSIGELLRTLEADFGLTKMDLQRAVSPMVERLLCVPLSSSRGDSSVLALVTPAAEAIAPHLVDLDIAPPDDSPFIADPDRPVDGRATIAVCMALRHLDVKRTTEDRPHRTATKRLAKQIGLDEAAIDKIVAVAAMFGLVGVDREENYRPNPAALADAAAGRYGNPVAAAIVARLERGPVAVAVLDRWRRGLFWHYFDPNTLALLPGFTPGTLGGLAAIARASQVESAAGHVTPSFEVFLPPESRLADIVAVVGCCELVRVDRVIVGKLTQASVARAVGAGSTGNEILAALAAASKVPIPQNVEAAIRDWAGNVSSAIVDEGIVVVVAPHLSDKVRAQLAGLHARELGNGTFVLQMDTSRQKIDAALAKAGVQPRRELFPGTPQIGRREIPPIDRGSPMLRARVAAWRHDDPVERKRAQEIATFVPLGPESGVPSVKAVNDAVEALAVWERAHRRIPTDELKLMIGLFASTDRRLWQPILGRATNLDELRHGIAQLVASGKIDDVLEDNGVRRTGSKLAVPPSRDPTNPANRTVPWRTDRLFERIGELEPGITSRSTMPAESARSASID